MLKIPALINKFCDAVWEYDADSNKVYMYYDDMTPELCNRWVDYDNIYNMYKEKYVYQPDMGIWERYLSHEGLSQFVYGTTPEEHFYIRFVNTRNGREWHEVYCQRLEEHRILLASRDMKESYRNEVIAQAVVPEYDYVCCIDVATESYVLYYSDAGKAVVPQTVSDNYHKTLVEFNRETVVPEQVEKLTKQMRLECVYRELENKDEYILYATVKEFGGVAYKKLRFSYKDSSKDTILLTRTDIGDIVAERQLREREKEKRLQYLENMPMAFCSTEVLLDDNGEPYDFKFTYCNRAHEELEGVQEGELLGKNFYEFFGETDPKWLNYYYETAYKGINHVIRRYSPEIQKYLLIYTFQSELGHCECVLLDVSEQQFLARELENSRENMRKVLEMTTDLVFQYRPDTGDVIMDGKDESHHVISKDELRQKILENKMIDADCWDDFKDGFARLESGEHSVSVVVRARISPNENWGWYRITLFDFQDGHTHERRVMGFLQNISQDMSREEELRKRAETDSLTGVLNAGAGKHQICKILESKLDDDCSYHAMIVMDMDNFKNINDTMGHLMGDKTLTEFAKVLRKTFRTEDVIYRLGGDEFVVFAEKIYDPEQTVEAMVHRLHMNMEKLRETYPFMRCSIGVFVTDKCRSFDKCYEMADSALYETKNCRKGYYTIKRDD